MKRPPRPTRERVVLKRADGCDIARAGTALRVTGETVRKIEGDRAPQVAYDPRDESWRIYFYDLPLGSEQPPIQPAWWPVRWLRFASREAAVEHLMWRGAW